MLDLTGWNSLGNLIKPIQIFSVNTNTDNLHTLRYTWIDLDFLQLYETILSSDKSHHFKMPLPQMNATLVPPTSQPFSAVKEHHNKLSYWQNSSSIFNTCEYQTLLLMSVSPMKLNIDPNTILTVIHTLIPEPSIGKAK